MQIGDRAPDFRVADENGQPVTLQQFRGWPVVLYFFPRANTPG